MLKNLFFLGSGSTEGVVDRELGGEADGVPASEDAGESLGESVGEWCGGRSLKLLCESKEDLLELGVCGGADAAGVYLGGAAGIQSGSGGKSV